MQGGQQFKVDQPGLIKTAPIALGVAAVLGLVASFAFGLGTLLAIAAGLFAGVWYVMTIRRGGSMPAQMDALVNGAILGAVAGLVFGIVLLIVLNLRFSGLGLFGFDLSGIIVDIVLGALLGAGGAFGYMYLVQQGTIK